jgi:outer membrane receptor protein involved in Fe transport
LTILAMWPGVAAAQNAGAVKGLVLDDVGQPLGGVTITVSGSGDMVIGRGAISGLDGSFLIPSLPPASDYRILAVFPAYTTITLTDVPVVAGQITRIEITMQRETVLQERIEVRGKPQVVSVETTTTSTRFSSEFIDSMPILGRNYQDMLSLAPGVSDIDGDGNPNIHGARDTDVITLVDGVSTTDPLTGKLGAQLNIESIQEIEIKTSGATAEFSRAQGGFANIVTKSGGNDFQGTFKIFWQGSALDGDGAGGVDPMLHAGVGDAGLREVDFNTFLPFLSFEGPIVRDRAWFFMAHEYVRVQDPINALTSTFVTSTEEWREFLKLTWQMNTNNRLAFSLNYDPLLIENQGLGSLYLDESGFSVERGGLILTLRETAILSPLVSLDTMVSSFDERPSQQPTLNPDTNGNGILSIDSRRTKSTWARTTTTMAPSTCSRMATETGFSPRCGRSIRSPGSSSSWRPRISTVTNG